MIAYLKGMLAGRDAASAVVDVGGIGFSVGMSGHSLSGLPEVGRPVQVLTCLQLREDGASLFGFTTAQEKELFERLVSVSGVGPKVALAALSTFTPQALAAAIAAGDAKLVSSVPGIGKKTAQRIILELQGTLVAEGADAPGAAAGGVTAAVVEDLLSMGFTQTEADLALAGAPDEADEAALLGYALKRLGGR